MILSVSRRTDIPAFYSEWFFNRIKEGFVYVRNPMNIHCISHIPINKDVVDGIVFWSKNPSVMMSRLDELSEFNYYFQFTVNSYNQHIETNVPEKKHVINTFKRLSDLISPKRVIWRYDPILITSDINLEYHTKYFEVLAKELKGFTNLCMISFVDFYKKTERNLRSIEARELTENEIHTVAQKFVEICQVYNLKIQTCAEKINLDSYGIKHGRCIDNELIEEISNSRLEVTKDKNQRDECGCISSIDIGEYNTCRHNCLYCYANFNKCEVDKKFAKHNSLGPLLVGEVGEKDIVKERNVNTLINNNSLF